MQTIKYSIRLLTCAFFITMMSCNNDEPVTPDAPTTEDAQFTYSIDPNNANRITFTATSNVDAWFAHWNFGDNTAAEGSTVQKLFPLAGDYEVRFKIFTEGGTAESTQTISIAEDIIGPNLVENGTFDDNSAWTILPISGGADVNFQNGQAVWTGGGWGQVGIYQTMDVVANTTYQVQMDVAGSGMTDCWFEVYVGTAAPVDGQDYTDGGIRLGLNTWDGCGADPFDAPLTAISCSNGGGDGTFSFPNDETVYLVVRSGGADLGTDGVAVDNISVREF